MDLNALWFVLIAALFVGFFFLEGFDYGAGILLPWVARNDRERRVVFNALGPFWDGNEVWLVTAGGAIFAAFPHWYATLFSGFYWALVPMLLALIARGVSFEFRSKDDHSAWRATWDWLLFAGSLLPAFLWGVAVSNLIKGVPIDQQMNFVGDFSDLWSLYTLLGGLVTLSLFALHGALFLSLKTTGAVMERAQRFARWLWLPAVILVLGFATWGHLVTDIFRRLGPIDPKVPSIAATLALLGTGFLLQRSRCGWAFATTGIAIAAWVAAIFIGLFPRVMVSSLEEAWDLSIYNASSSPYTLEVMSWVALCLVPVVLAYQGWTYWIFRKRISPEGELEY